MTTIQTGEVGEVTRTEPDESPGVQDTAITELGSVSKKTQGTWGPYLESSFSYRLGST